MAAGKAASEAVKRLVKWVPEVVRPTAEQIEEFGPNASQILSMSKLLKRMSYDADAVSDLVTKKKVIDVQDTPEDLLEKSYETIYAPNLGGDKRSWNLARAERFISSNAPSFRPMTLYPALASDAESVSDLIPSELYKSLVSPMAAGRAVDVLAPRYGSPFLDAVRKATAAEQISSPADVAALGRITASSDAVKDTAMTFIEDGMNPEEALRAALFIMRG